MAIERRGGGRPVFSSMPDPVMNELENLALPPGSAPPAKKASVKKAQANPLSLPERSPLVSAEAVSADDRQLDQTLDQKIRPHQLSEYIGQQALKDSLAISLQAARQRGEPLDHLLFYGPPGLGKTTLAMALAHAMGATLHTTSAPALERPRDIIGLLMSLQDPEQQAEAATAAHGGDILFIDEIHRLNTVSEEILYSAMEDFTLDHTVGKGSSAKTLRIPLPRFTLIGATTKAGALSNPLRDRFGMLYRLNFYTQTELEQIVTRSAKILGLGITEEGAAAIARRSRGTPRIANRLLRRVRDFAIARAGLTLNETQNSSQPNDCITATIAEDALNLYEIDPLGLDQTDRALLTHLVDTFGGGPVGLDTLASILGEDARTLEDVVEPYLLQVGLVSRTPRGRTATPLTYQHLNKPLPGLRVF